MKDENLLCDRNGDIYEAVQNALHVLSVQESLEWDMSVISEATDSLIEILQRHNIPVCYPWEDEDADICYSLIEDRCDHCGHCVTLQGGKTMQTNHPKLIGYSQNETRELNSVQEVAEFICQEGIHSDLTIRTEDGDFFLNTFGIFINRIADMDYRQELLEVLIPMQMEQEGSMGGMTM